MIKITPEFSTGRIGAIEYINDGIRISIETRIPFVNDRKSNVGHIVENYRLNNNQDYWESNRGRCFKDIKEAEWKDLFYISNFTPRYYICFYPADKNRKELLEYTKDQVIKQFDTVHDLSNTFTKKDSSKSIKIDSDSSNYELSMELNAAEIESILIFDDTIDTGKTLKIYLDMLYGKNLINNKTKVCFIAIYNNGKIKDIETD